LLPDLVSRGCHNVVILTLAGILHLAVVLHLRERGARSEEATALSVGDSLLKRALGFAGRIGEWENDGVLVQASHALENSGSEGAANGRKTHENGWLDILNNVVKSLELLALVVVSGEVDLVISELVATVVGDETLGVDEPELALGFVFRQTLLDEVFHDLLGYSDAGTASAKEYSTVILGSDTGGLDGVYESTNDDGTSSLDVIVEHGIRVLVSLERGEGVLPVFELNNDTKSHQ